MVRAEYSKGSRDIVLVIPTGGGKTATGGTFAANGVARGNPVLWLAHRTELIDQAAETLRNLGLHVGEIQADRTRDTTAPVQVATVQTLAARGETPPAKIVVHDECHHTTAATFRGVKDRYPDAVHLGLTATPGRADGTGLNNVFTSMVAPTCISELIAGGWLVPCDVDAPERYSDSLSMDPVDAIREKARGQVIVFNSNVNAAKVLAGALNLAGITAGYVDGTQSDRMRRDTIARFKSGELRVLTNVYVLTEGFDHPPTETVMLARGCGSESTFLQMVGRGLRSAPGKSRALLIDLMGCVHKHGLPDEDRDYSLEGDPLKAKEARVPLRTCPECACVFRTKPKCPRCGFEFPAPRGPAVDTRAMSRIGAVDGKEKQLDAWERIVRNAKLRGFKPGWAAHRFRELFGFWPPRLFPRFEEVV
jgi:superfamily II DNA or RNA helicase